MSDQAGASPARVAPGLTCPASRPASCSLCCDSLPGAAVTAAEGRGRPGGGVSCYCETLRAATSSYLQTKEGGQLGAFQVVYRCLIR